MKVGSVKDPVNPCVCRTNPAQPPSLGATRRTPSCFDALDRLLRPAQAKRANLQVVLGSRAPCVLLPLRQRRLAQVHERVPLEVLQRHCIRSIVAQGVSPFLRRGRRRMALPSGVL
jgi:hypothetical protein